ncbi:hypothetical protein L3X38_016381 [Prunus dulcis]|uniref:Uncharacterized protein n=1 Tax=Prunus dulcis TaxID=3755 RepID=A0AAD4W7W1_PRUDU|nr:hypothetical protein L3X38_016381 [Prunus dulcis]
MSILELIVPAGWKVWGHFTGLITFSPVMVAGSTSMVLSCTLIPIFHDCLFSLKMNQTEAIEEANAKEADKVANQLQSTGISSSGDRAASSSAPKQEEVKRLPGGKIKKKERQAVTIEAIKTV